MQDVPEEMISDVRRAASDVARVFVPISEKYSNDEAFALSMTSISLFTAQLFHEMLPVKKIDIAINKLVKTIREGIERLRTDDKK